MHHFHSRREKVSGAEFLRTISCRAAALMSFWGLRHKWDFSYFLCFAVPLICKLSRCISHQISESIFKFFLFGLPLASHELCSHCLRVSDEENLHIAVKCFLVSKGKRLSEAGEMSYPLPSFCTCVTVTVPRKVCTEISAFCSVKEGASSKHSCSYLGVSLWLIRTCWWYLHSDLFFFPFLLNIWTICAFHPFLLYH